VRGPPARRLPPPPPRTPRRPQPPATKKPSTVARFFDEEDATILDLVDNLLTKGVLLNGEVVLGLAGVDLVYLQLSVLLCAADRLLGAAASGRGRARRRIARRARPRAGAS
jgi:hypothetical protein